LSKFEFKILKVMKKIVFVFLLLVFNYSILITNITFAQNWTACYNGMFNGCYGVNCLEKLNNYIFASTCDDAERGNGIIYRSSDDGLNWFLMNNIPGMYSGSTILVSGSDLFVGTLSYGLYYSSDYGQNWVQRGFNTSGYSTVYGIGKSGPNLLVYVTSSTSLCYSTDNGLNWNSVTTWPLYKTIHSFLNVNNLIFAGCISGIYVSSNNGITWTEKGLQSTNVQKLYYFQGSIYAGADGAIYKSTDEGLNWNSCSFGISYATTYSFSSIGNLLFAGTTLGVYCSSNGGNYWYSVNSGMGTPTIKNALLSSGTKLYSSSTSIGGIRGLFATTNYGENWSKSGFRSFNISSLILIGSTLFVGTDSSGIYYSSNEGSTWYPTKNELNNNSILSLINHGSNIFAGTVDSGVYKSTNNGQNWLRVNSGLGNFFIKTFFSKDTILYAGTNSGIYKTINSGSNWTYFGLSATPVNAIIAYNNNLLSGTDNGVQITTNNGINWISGILSGKIIKGFYIFQNKIYSGTNNGVYISTDNGFDWYQNGLSSYTINSFASFSDTLTCSTSNGVYVTSNNGINWIWLGPRAHGETKSILVYNGNIYSSGDILNHETGCVWKRIASTLSGIKNISNEIVSNYCLFQNYPNPFNPVTKIKFNIKKEYRSQESEVKLSIYDILGRKIEDLVNEKLQPGTYEVEWNASQFSSGVYFYQFRAGDFNAVMKMVLIR